MLRVPDGFAPLDVSAVPAGSRVSVGDRFGSWVVCDEQAAVQHKPGNATGKSKRLYYAQCACDCGNLKWVFIENLKRGMTKSCGCLPAAKVVQRCTTHGMSDSPIYAVWNMVQQRTQLKTSKSYPDYGGRGIDMDPRWLKFDVFYADVGEPPFKGASLERVDNDKGYWPGNVVWADRKAQGRNKRNNVRYEYLGHSLILPDWAELVGINPRTLSSRVLCYGWDIARAVTEPVTTRSGGRQP